MTPEEFLGYVRAGLSVVVLVRFSRGLEMWVEITKVEARNIAKEAKGRGVNVLAYRRLGALYVGR